MSEEQKVVFREIPMEETTIFNEPMTSDEVPLIFGETPPELVMLGCESWEEFEAAKPGVNIENDSNSIPAWAR